MGDILDQARHDPDGGGDGRHQHQSSENLADHLRVLTNLWKWVPSGPAARHTSSRHWLRRHWRHPRVRPATIPRAVAAISIGPAILRSFNIRSPCGGYDCSRAGCPTSELPTASFYTYRSVFRGQNGTRIGLIFKRSSPVESLSSPAGPSDRCIVRRVYTGRYRHLGENARLLGEQK